MEPVYQFQHTHLYFMPKIRLELTTKAASMLCSTNWASQAYGDTRNWTWESDVQSRCFTKLNYTPLYLYIYTILVVALYISLFLLFFSSLRKQHCAAQASLCTNHYTNSKNYLISEERLERSRLLTSKA